MATIGADGAKYPPIFIAKEKTNTSLRQFEDMTADSNNYELSYSAGWFSSFFKKMCIHEIKTDHF